MKIEDWIFIISVILMILLMVLVSLWPREEEPYQRKRWRLERR